MRPSAILVVTLATVQLVAAVASLYFGILILDPAAFPRPGSRAVPALLFCFCLAAVLAGVVLVVRRDLTACRAVALWDLMAGLFFLIVALTTRPNQEVLILAAGCVAVFGALIAIPSAILLVLIAIAQTAIGILGFLYIGAVIFAGAAYLGVGPGAGPALLFCLAGAAAGVVLSIKRNVAACRGVALWNLVAGLFFLLALSFARHPLVSFARHPHPEDLIPAAAFLEVFIVLIVPLVPCPTAHARNRPVETNSSG